MGWLFVILVIVIIAAYVSKSGNDETNRIANNILMVCYSFAFVFGLILMYAGYCMAQGHFWGEHYTYDDYTTFYIGAGLSIASLLLFLVTTYGLPTTNLKLKKGIVIIVTIKTLSIISMIIGILFAITAIAKDESPLSGLIGFVGAVTSYGFAYIVEAACKYLEKCEAEEISAIENETEE